MKKQFQEKDVVHLLGRWKRRDASYPEKLQRKRRDAFLALGLSAIPHNGLGGLTGKAAAHASTHAANVPMTIGMKITLGVLSSVIVGMSGYLGVILYTNHETLRDLLANPTSTLVWTPPSPTAGQMVLPPAIPTDTPVPTATLVATTTPFPTEETNTGSGNPQGTPTKPGLHIGQTKTPKP